MACFLFLLVLFFLFTSQIKRKKRTFQKAFYFKIILTFSSLKKQEEKVSKKKKLSLFSTLLRALNKMDIAGEPALSRSLKNARGASDVQYIFLLNTIELLNKCLHCQ